MFVPNLTSKSVRAARRPEMTRPLPAKVGPIEEGVDTQRLLGERSAILSFSRGEIRVSTTGRPKIEKSRTPYSSSNS